MLGLARRVILRLLCIFALGDAGDEVRSRYLLLILCDRPLSKLGSRHIMYNLGTVVAILGWLASGSSRLRGGEVGTKGWRAPMGWRVGSRRGEEDMVRLYFLHGQYQIESHGKSSERKWGGRSGEDHVACRFLCPPETRCANHCEPPGAEIPWRGRAGQVIYI